MYNYFLLFCFICLMTLIKYLMVLKSVGRRDNKFFFQTWKQSSIFICKSEGRNRRALAVK